MKLEGQKLVEAGVHPDVLEYAISLACEEVKKYLKSIARRISTFEEIAQVGAAAAKGNKAIGELVAKAIEQVGTGGHFLLFDEENFDSKLEFFNCMKLNSGHASDFFFTTRRNTEFVWKNPLVLIHENKISNMNIVEKAIVQAGGRRQPLLIVAEGLKEKLGASLMPNKTQLQTGFCVIKPADIQENRKAIMQDLAIFTGAKVLNGASDSSFTPSMLGSCKMAVMSHDEMLFLGGSGCQVTIEERCDQLRSAIKLSTSDYELELLKERLAQLSHAAAVIKVLGAIKMSKKNNPVLNALEVASLAMEEGIVPGAGVALALASKELDKLQTTKPNEKIAIQLFQNALQLPMRAIIPPHRLGTWLAVKRLLHCPDDPVNGYDPQKVRCVDMIKSRIFDPLKSIIGELDEIRRLFSSDCRYYHSYILEKKKPTSMMWEKTSKENFA